MNGNPWNLTEAQCRVLAALATHGHEKVAASELGIEPRDVQTLVAGAKKRMNIPHRIAAVVAFDRWARGQKAEAA